MVITDLKGKEIIWKGNKCLVLDVQTDSTGAFVVQIEAEETETTKTNPWIPIDEVRVDVYYTQRPRLFGVMVDAHDGFAKVEWKDADGEVVPFKVYPPNHEYAGHLMLDKENRPIMTVKVFDSKLSEISLF
jgi:hypothetical protein